MLKNKKKNKKCIYALPNKRRVILKRIISYSILVCKTYIHKYNYGFPKEMVYIMVSQHS